MFDHMVHHFARKKNKRGQMVETLVRFSPYKCVVVGRPPIKYFLREGEVFSADGKKLDPKKLPPDAVATFQSMTEEGKKHYGVPKVA